MWTTSYLSRCIYTRVYSNIYITNSSVPMFINYVRGLSITTTIKLISDVLRVPQVEKLDYSRSLVLSSFSRDALASRLCEFPSTLGGTLSMVTCDFAQNPRILNMIMTFICTLQSHYNTIIETRARFLYSLLKVYP